MVITPNLGLLKRAIGSRFPAKLENSWGNAINDDLEAIDRAIGEVCTPEQVEQIKARLTGLQIFKAT